MMQSRSKIIADLCGTAMGLVGLAQGISREIRGKNAGKTPRRGATSEVENEELSMVREALAYERKQREILEERIQKLEKRAGKRGDNEDNAQENKK